MNWNNLASGTGGGGVGGGEFTCYVDRAAPGGCWVVGDGGEKSDGGESRANVKYATLVLQYTRVVLVSGPVSRPLSKGLGVIFTWPCLGNCKSVAFILWKNCNGNVASVSVLLGAVLTTTLSDTPAPQRPAYSRSGTTTTFFFFFVQGD